MSKTVSFNEMQQHANDYDGFCTTCQEFTNGGIDPDARECTCEVCGAPTVYGTEEAMIEGFIDVTS